MPMYFLSALRLAIVSQAPRSCGLQAQVLPGVPRGHRRVHSVQGAWRGGARCVQVPPAQLRPLLPPPVPAGHPAAVRMPLNEVRYPPVMLMLEESPAQQGASFSADARILLPVCLSGQTKILLGPALPSPCTRAYVLQRVLTGISACLRHYIAPCVRGSLGGSGDMIFTCPAHFCHTCNVSGDSRHMLRCWCCPTSYHTRCAACLQQGRQCWRHVQDIAISVVTHVMLAQTARASESGKAE